jgi:hypothetical protein
MTDWIRNRHTKREWKQIARRSIIRTAAAGTQVNKNSNNKTRELKIWYSNIATEMKEKIAKGLNYCPGTELCE